MVPNIKYGVLQIRCNMDGSPLPYLEMMTWGDTHEMSYMQAVSRCRRIGKNKGQIPFHHCLSLGHAVKALPWLVFVESFAPRRGTQVVICKVTRTVSIYCPVPTNDI